MHYDPPSKHGYGAGVPSTLFDHLIGKTEEEAVAAIEAQHFEYRVIKRDGKSLIGDCAMHPYRANLAIKDGKLAGVTWG
jgi:hypothetical protein